MPICHCQPLEGMIPFEIYLEGTQEAICSNCAEKYAPDLYKLICSVDLDFCCEFEETSDFQGYEL